MKTDLRDKTILNLTEIDLQHRTIVNLFHDLNQAIAGNKASDETKIIFEKLDRYIMFHFATEERYFKKFSYPEAATHIKEHKSFKKMIQELENNFKNNELKTSVFLLKYLEKWIKRHVLETDTKYADHFRRHGLR